MGIMMITKSPHPWDMECYLATALDHVLDIHPVYSEFIEVHLSQREITIAASCVHFYAEHSLVIHPVFYIAWAIAVRIHCVEQWSINCHHI